ncbi:MAG: tRNA preQ1(34) S-adenosylmethionine ribosyltransferase-isomerase QueA [Elusimicrobia bacterium]|nr:tRNA preQ1(34) S-adenosylmethionine ribosyltransferase-isomerase QueA [Elusimicrobiota bacterium]
MLLDFPEIPQELIAQEPLKKRDDARLMVLNRREESIHHNYFHQLDQYIGPGDVLVLNDARVFPARLRGKKSTGGRVTVLLLKRFGKSGAADRWLALLTPSLRIGADIHFEGELSAVVENKIETGEYVLLFSRPVDDDLKILGEMPLPPYIHRENAGTTAARELDALYYQTVYAREEDAPAEGTDLTGPKAPGAVAAPTAGLHFTEELLGRIKANGVRVVTISLKVGWGTFRPLQDPDYRRHRMLPEEYSVSGQAAHIINEARRRGKRIWAVGTTTVRTLESVVDEDGLVRPGSGESDLYVYPGHRFRAVDAMVTNFHLPGYTPLLMTAAFAGAEFLRRAYETAVQERYRFFSYGDGMVIL